MFLYGAQVAQMDFSESGSFVSDWSKNIPKTLTISSQVFDKHAKIPLAGHMSQGLDYIRT